MASRGSPAAGSSRSGDALKVTTDTLELINEASASPTPDKQRQQSTCPAPAPQHGQPPAPYPHAWAHQYGGAAPPRPAGNALARTSTANLPQLIPKPSNAQGA